jgi:MFS family permease
VPIFLILQLGTVSGSDIAFFSSIVLLPFAVKFIYGMLSDKFSFKKIGRRRPWIIGSVSLAGVLWMLIPFVITPSNALIMFTLVGFFITLGIAIGDTSIDGLILDIVPKGRLGRVQGFCWSLRSVGVIAGGPILVAIFLLTGLDIKWIFFGYGIVVIITSFFTLFVKEFRIVEKVNLLPNLKSIFGKGENWKAFIFSLFNAFVDGVIFLFIALFIILQMGFIEAEGATLSALEEDVTLYPANALINLIIGVGVIIGALIGGYLADLKTRKLSVYSSLIVTTIALLLFLIPAHYILLFIFAFIVGASSGWRNSGFSAVIGQMSTNYPETDSTYFATCTSFANLGTTIGLNVIGIFFEGLSALPIMFAFAAIFVFMAIIGNAGAIPFALIKDKEYELPEKVELHKE